MAKAAENKLILIVITILIFALTIIFVLPVCFNQFISYAGVSGIKVCDITDKGIF